MRFLFVLFLAGILFTSSYGQQVTFPEGYYVIVGAFAKRSNAERFNAALRDRQMKSEYGYLSSRKLYYVYTFNDQDVARCQQAAEELRKEQAFSDAWVRYIKEELPVEEIKSSGMQIAVLGSDTDTPGEKQPEQTVMADTVAEAKAEPEMILPGASEVNLGNTEAFLSLYNSQNDKVATGNVQVIDTERTRMLEEVKGNEYINLPNPKSKSGQISLICDVMGYRKVQKDLNFNNPLSDSTVAELVGTTLVVSFDLMRYQKGDFRILYNIYFFNDAAVMMPESKYELNGLLNMMKDNPNYRIRLHGHTNGNYHGKIIRRGPSGDFFSVAKDATTGSGSAKELSESRAEVIRDYLVANGVEASRVEIKAWGGKRPIYDKNSANAKKNIRVEVEIISE